jgi:hypothetical protein
VQTEAPPIAEPLEPAEPRSGFPTQPWMRYTGVSFLGAIIAWFRMPKPLRRTVETGAFATMLLFAAVFIGILVLMWVLAYLMR